MPRKRKSDQPQTSCLSGAVRDGPGKFGVSIDLGDGNEPHVLFTRGVPVFSKADMPFSFEQSEDQFIVDGGDELYEIPEALMNGGCTGTGATRTCLVASPKPRTILRAERQSQTGCP